MRDVLAHDSRRVRLLALLGIAAAFVLARAEASQAALALSTNAVAAETSEVADEGWMCRSTSEGGPCFFLALRVLGGGRIASSMGYSGERVMCPPQDGWGCVLPLAINDGWFNWPFGAETAPQIVLTAITTTGQFAGWTDCPRAPSGTQCVVHHSDLEELNYEVCVTANFQGAGDTGPCADAAPAPIGDPVNVTKVGAGQGRITSMPTGINCGNVTSGPVVCSRVFPQLSTVTLAAHPAPGSQFAGWSGYPCNGSSTATICEFMMPFGDETNPPPPVNMTATFSGTPPPPPPPPMLNTVLFKKPAKTTRKRTATFAWGATRNGTAYFNFKSQCKLNKQVWKACSAPKTYRKLKAGRTHTVRIRVGYRSTTPRWDTSPVKYSWRIRR